MASIPNSQLLIAGILRQARAQPNPQAWLLAKHTAALEAVMAGDEFITSTTDEAGSNMAERGMTAAQLLELYEAALSLLEAETGGASCNGSIRHADFSNYPSTLG